MGNKSARSTLRNSLPGGVCHEVPVVGYTGGIWQHGKELGLVVKSVCICQKGEEWLAAHEWAIWMECKFLIDMFIIILTMANIYLSSYQVQILPLELHGMKRETKIVFAALTVFIREKTHICKKKKKTIQGFLWQMLLTTQEPFLSSQSALHIPWHPGTLI